MKKIFSVRLPSLVAVLLGISLFTSQTISHATTIIHTPFAQMCREADAIIEGVVSSVNSRSVSDPLDPFPTIVTDVVLTDVVTIKGSRPNPFTLTHSGGTVNDVAMIVPGVPHFQVGERKIIFLKQNDIIFGVWEGAFTVKEGSTRTLVERADGYLVTGIDPSTGELGLHTFEEGFSKPLTYVRDEEFHDLIRSILDRGGGGKGELSE